MKKIEIDNQACGNPLACRLCLDRCPEKVFGAYPRQARTPERRAGDWAVAAVFAYSCTGCGDCMRFCPQGAIVVR